jgi:hypothetical protein
VPENNQPRNPLPPSPNRPDDRVYKPESQKKAEKMPGMTEQAARARLARLQREGKN